MTTKRFGFLIAFVASSVSGWAEPGIVSERIIPWQPEHVHASSVVALPNGDALACWYQGSGERQANDARIVGARKAAGGAGWSAPFVMADTPEFPDCNPTLFLDRRERLWLFWTVVRANRWENSLLKYRRSANYRNAGPPDWSWQDAILLRPGDAFADAVLAGFKELGVDEPMWAEYAPPYERLLASAARDARKRQEGWMTRNQEVWGSTPYGCTIPLSPLLNQKRLLFARFPHFLSVFQPFSGDTSHTT